MRYIIIFLIIYLCYVILRKALIPLLRTYKLFKRYQKTSNSNAKEMVQDPYCQTYIPKETALKATIGGEVFYFCSRKCLEEFKKNS
ncbi:MAG: YHS domain-containing protein [Deltaproteobacteria bacterium]|nr:YHS domain-containing protein [Deltaproteobacteria bacterium]